MTSCGAPRVCPSVRPTRPLALATTVAAVLVLVVAVVAGASPGTPASAAPSLTGATPVADLVVSSPSATASQSVVADGSGSTDDVEVTSYTFDWGDGASTGPTVEATARHAYPRPGRYVVTLTVTDGDGGSASTSTVMRVVPRDPVPPPNAAPTARVKATPKGPTAPLAVSVDASGSRDDRGVTRYSFDFGDGSSTTVQPASSVEHHYSEPGTYTIAMTAFDESGLQDTATTTVSVDEEPEPLALANEPTTVSFTFDDGFADQVGAATVLSEYGMGGTFYVNSPRLGTTSLYMTRAQADALVATGHEIGGHTLGHVDLADVSTVKARRQICDDRANLVAMGYRSAASRTRSARRVPR